MYLWFIAAFTAYFIKGLCGFANTLVFTTILSFAAPNASISPVDLLMGYPANLILTWKNRRHLDLKVYLPLAVQVLAGSIPGVIILKNVDARSVKLVFGIVVITLGMEMLSRECSKKRDRSSKLVLSIIGISAGVLCGLFRVGALLAAYVSRLTENDGSFKVKYQRNIYSRQHLSRRSLYNPRPSYTRNNKSRYSLHSFCAGWFVFRY